MGSEKITAGHLNQGAIEDVIKFLPQYLQSVGAAMTPIEQAKLQAEQAVAPGRAQLQLDQYRTFGPQFSQIGSQIAGQEALAQAENDRALLNGPGADVVNQLINLQRTADPEYYKSREYMASQMQRLNDSIVDPDAPMSGSERAEVDRSLARDNAMRGNDSGSSLKTVENALNFGAAGENRRMARQEQIGKILGTTAGASGALRSGMDVGAATLGRPVTNAGQTRFGDPQSVGNEATNAGQNLFGTFAGNYMNSAVANQNRKTALDRANETMTAIGSMLNIGVGGG